MGEECYTCGSIDGKFNANLRQIGLPFDYVGHTYVESILKNLQDLCLSNNFEINEDKFDIQKFNDAFYFVHKDYGFKYWHDTSNNNSVFSQEQKDAFYDKYKRRYERLKNILLTKNPTILSINHFDNIYNDIYKENEIIALNQFLKNINSKISFVAINYRDGELKNENLNFLVLKLTKLYHFLKAKKNSKKICMHLFLKYLKKKIWK